MIDGGLLRKLAVFDLDGTLHHTELALAPAIARAASEVTGAAEPRLRTCECSLWRATGSFLQSADRKRRR